MTNFLPPPGTAYENLETPHLVIDVPAMTHDIEALHTIGVLEYFDGAGFTRRIGDARIVVRRAADLFG